jgi:hypothetical protein
LKAAAARPTSGSSAICQTAFDLAHRFRSTAVADAPSRLPIFRRWQSWDATLAKARC